VTLFSEARIAAGRPHPWLEQLFANALFSAGRVDEALQHYRLSCELGPRNELCHYSIAEILFSRRELHPAIEEYRLALMFTRDQNIALSCLLKSGEALAELGEFDAAEQAVRHALQIDGTNTRAQSLLEQMVSQGTSGRREGHHYVTPYITIKPNALDLSRPLRP
jgi:tetratricopeptide (TPR) repeat protein